MTINEEFHQAVEECDLARVQECIRLDADVDSCGEDGTALMVAVHSEHPFNVRKALIAMLLASNANLNATSEEKATALIVCALNGAYREMALLIEARANLHAVDDEGDNALHYAAVNSLCGRSTEHAMLKATECLVMAGVSPSHRNKSGWTPVQTITRNYQGESHFQRIVTASQAAYAQHELRRAVHRPRRQRRAKRVM